MRLPSILLLLLNLSDCLSTSDWWDKNASDPSRCLQEEIEFPFSPFDHMICLANWLSSMHCWKSKPGCSAWGWGAVAGLKPRPHAGQMLYHWTTSPAWCLSPWGHLLVGTVLTSASFSRSWSIHILRWSCLGLAWDLPAAEGCFLSPTGNNLLGTATLGCQSLTFTVSPRAWQWHYCWTD